MAQFKQIARLPFPGMDPVFLQHYYTMIDGVNNLAGFNGPVMLNNHLNLQGNQINDVGAPTAPGDVVSNEFAQSNFSASAIRPQLEGNGSNPLQTVRQLNSSYQRENTSSFLNRLMSTPPNANTATVSFVNNVGSTQITVSPVVLGFSDGTNISISGRTDTVVNPTSFTISTITATGMSATVVTTAPNGILAGQVVYILGNSNPVFNNPFTVSGVTPPDTFTIAGSFGSTSGTGGTVSLGGVFYYTAQNNKLTMTMIGPFNADTPQNRLEADLDQSQILAVAIVGAGGGVSAQSGGGGTPTTGNPAGGTFF